MSLDTPSFISAVRDYISLEVDGSSRYTDETIGSNVRAAMNFMERRTNRFLFQRDAYTLMLTSNGDSRLTIPGLRTVTSVTLAGSTLSADSTYWLSPDDKATGLYTGLALRGYNTNRGGPWYLGIPDWFDRNLDHPYWNSPSRSSLPNDLVIVGDWGFLATDYPEEVLHVGKVLSAYFTKRGESLVSGGVITQAGGVFDLSQFPVEVQSFVSDWGISPMAALA